MQVTNGVAASELGEVGGRGLQGLGGRAATAGVDAMADGAVFAEKLLTGDGNGGPGRRRLDGLRLAGSGMRHQQEHARKNKIDGT